MERIGNLLGLLIIVVALFGHESAMNVFQKEQINCTFLCSKLSNGFPEEIHESLATKQASKYVDIYYNTSFENEQKYAVLLMFVTLKLFFEVKNIITVNCLHVLVVL
jgi:hypothetical protein